MKFDVILGKYPKHLKENTVFTNQFESFPDNYKYLDFSINDQMLQKKLDFLANNQDFKKYMDFLGQETMYTNYSLARMQRIEEKISKEYFSLVGGFNVQPLHYDDWIYYSKDPRLTSKSIFDVYRVQVPKNTVSFFFIYKSMFEIFSLSFLYGMFYIDDCFYQ